MEVDKALTMLGTIGRWQVRYFSMIGAACMVLPSINIFVVNYIGAWPEHHCKVPDGAFINETIPLKEDGSYDSCRVYTDEDRNETIKCNEWKYYYGDIGPTIVSKWDLVCDRAYLKDLSQVPITIGSMFGCLICSILSDKFGRKPIFLVSHWVLVAVGVSTAFAPNYYFFVASRFFTGVFLAGILLPGIVMASELFAAKYRTFAVTIIQNFWSAAMCFLALLAFLVQNWFHLQLIISLFGVLTIPLYWLLQESVVWLCAKNRVAEAEQIIRNAAKLNNITMPDRILAHSETPDDDKDDDADKKKGSRLLQKLRNLRNSSQSEEDAAARYTIIDIFRNRHLTVNVLCMIFAWMVVSLVYYGLSLSAGQLAGNMYLNNFISAFVEFPANTSAFFAAQKLGRRRSLVAYYATAGIALILSQVIPEQAGGISLVAIRITFSMIGKFGITGAYAVVCLYTPEIVPTTIRSQSLALASISSSTVSLLAPFASLLTRKIPWLPALVFGVLSMAAGLISLLLPETLGRPLPQTIEDIEQWYSSKQPAGAKSADRGDQQEMSPMNRDQLNNDTVA